MRFSKKWMVAVFVGMCSFAVHADQCYSWGHRAYPVTMEACSYTSGGSGYYKITNDGNQTAQVCWTVVFNDGRKDSGCNSNLGPGQSTRGSCFSCGAKNGGARHILLEKYNVR